MSMTREEKIKLLQEKIASFKDEDFGEMLNSKETVKEKPEHIPPKGVHPRLYFTKNKIEEIKNNLTHQENKYAYEKYIELSECECDGEVTDFTDTNSMSHMRIIDSNILTCLNTKAFRYAITGDELYGYEAVAGVLTYLKTFDLSQMPIGMAHYSTMRIMEKIACIYDWCYDLLREEDKYHIACGVTGKCYQYLEYPDFPPTGGSLMVGHMSGAIFLVAWAAVGIALYDEYPDYYDITQLVVQRDLVPTQNFFMSSGENPQGSAYGPARENSLLYGDVIFSAMYDNKKHLFDRDTFEQTCLTFLHMIRPDGEMMRIGDEYNEGTRYASLCLTTFWGAYLYENPVLKGFAKKVLNNFSTFYTMSFTPVHQLIFNKPSLKAAPLSDLPLVQYIGSPMGSMYARTSWTDKDAVMTYMKIGEAYSANHEHKDAGNFQIFHKGILASKSGHYGLYHHPIDLAYNKQTVACNSILVFNPNIKHTPKWPYCGGQRTDDEVSEEALDYIEWKNGDAFKWGKVLYHDYKLENGELKYSCLCGDITGAYDKETVEEVKRYMFSLHTGRDDHPLAFFVFDRITSKDESYKKTMLLHTQARPMITTTPKEKKPCGMITNLSSRLYIQSLGTKVKYATIGGEGQQFQANRINYERTKINGEDFVFNFNVEEGWGRIEITPEKKAKTDCMLTVMYIGPDVDYSPKLVFGDSNILPFKEAVEIKGEGYLGGAILNNAVIFPENGNGFEKELSFTVPADVKHCYVLGLKGGKWSINGIETEVEKESGIAEFETVSKEITLKYIG